MYCSPPNTIAKLLGENLLGPMAGLPMRPPLYLVADDQTLLREATQLASILIRLAHQIVTDTFPSTAGGPQPDSLTRGEPREGLNEELLQTVSSFLSQCIAGEDTTDTATERGDYDESGHPDHNHRPYSEDPALDTGHVLPFYAGAAGEYFPS